MPPPYSDLIDFYKLQAEFSVNHVTHTSYIKDRARNVQRVRVEQRWNNIKRIGNGTFGEVWLQGGDSGAERAVKKLSKYSMEDLGIDYKRELEALAKFNTPRIQQEEVIVEFLGWFESDETVYLAMEYCPLGDLSKHIAAGEITETGAKQITRDLLEALTIIHDEGFTHRDIKPQNIFVMSTSPHWWVKLADFGISKRILSDQTALRTRIGTARYLAPEVEDDDLLDFDYTQAVDVWSLGCVVFHVLVQEPPFLTTSSKRKPFPEAQLEARSLGMALKFLRALLVRDPTQRPTARDALSSEWLRNANGSSDVDPGPSRARSEVQDRLSRQDTEERQPLQTALNSALTGLTITDDSTRSGGRSKALLAGHIGDAFKRLNAPTWEPSVSDIDRVVPRSGHDPSSTATVVGPKNSASEISTPGKILPISSRVQPKASRDPKAATILPTSSSSSVQQDASKDSEAITKAKQAIALFSYEPVQSNELRMVEGDTITEIDMCDIDWWVGQIRGVRGLFPQNYVELIENDDQASSKTPPVKMPNAVVLWSHEPDDDIELRLYERDLITNIKIWDTVWWGENPRGESGFFPSTKVELISVERDEPPMNFKSVVAMYDLRLGDRDGLPFDAGDMITVLNVPDPDWWIGEGPKGAVGLFPSNHVWVVEIPGINRQHGKLDGTIRT